MLEDQVEELREAVMESVTEAVRELQEQKVAELEEQQQQMAELGDTDPISPTTAASGSTQNG